MKDKMKEIIALFIEEVAMEDITHLKYTMSREDINKFLDDFLEEEAFKYLGNKMKPVTVPMKKTWHLKVTVEKEEFTIDDG